MIRDALALFFFVSVWILAYCLLSGEAYAGYDVPATHAASQAERIMAFGLVFICMGVVLLGATAAHYLAMLDRMRPRSSADDEFDPPASLEARARQNEGA